MRHPFSLATLSIVVLAGLACSTTESIPDASPSGTSSTPTTPGTPTGTSTTTTGPTDASGPDVNSPTDGSMPTTDAGNPGTPGVIGNPGMAAWDALSTTEKNKVLSFRSVFFHQSVGQDLESGAKANGYTFEYTEPGVTLAAGSKQGPYGGLAGSNGNPTSKTSAMTGFVNRNSAFLKVAILKFGYADVVASNIATSQSAYAAMVADIKSKGVRVLHVTPPLVFDTAENPPKMQMRTWMMSTFPNDVIFDLEDVESTSSSGTRCEVGGVWQICQEYRATSSCVSDQNPSGDAPSQGHLCLRTAATKISKAFLYAIYQAGK
jgi:hypothetical protein